MCMKTVVVYSGNQPRPQNGLSRPSVELLNVKADDTHSLLTSVLSVPPAGFWEASANSHLPNHWARSCSGNPPDLYSKRTRFESRLAYRVGFNRSLKAHAGVMAEYWPNPSPPKYIHTHCLGPVFHLLLWNMVYFSN
jgi:hypothetical protein